MSADNTPDRTGKSSVANLPQAKPIKWWPDTIVLVIALSVIGFVLGNLLGASKPVTQGIEFVVALGVAAYWFFTNRTGWLTIVAVTAFVGINLLPFGAIDLLLQIAMVVGVWRLNKHLREKREARRLMPPNDDSGSGFPGYGVQSGHNDDTRPSRQVNPRNWYDTGQ